jgi:hypothetical protein
MEHLLSIYALIAHGECETAIDLYSFDLFLRTDFGAWK